MKQFKFPLKALGCLLLTAALLTACEEDDEKDDFDPTPTIPDEGPDDNPDTPGGPDAPAVPYLCYFLAEGSFGQNNSTLAGFDGTRITPELYYNANGRNLGDTGQDLAWFGNSLYVTVSGSRYLAKLDLDGRELARYEFSESDGQPRYISTYRGDLYVSLWGGGIARFDTASLSLKGFCKAGASPEQTTIVGHYLISANSGNGDDHTLTVIDLDTFTPVQTLEVGPNPTRITTTGNGKAYFTTTTYDASWTPTTALHELDSRNWSLRTLRTSVGKGMWFTAAGDELYIVESETDYSAYPYAVRNTFLEYDCDDDRFEPAGFLVAALQSHLAGSSIYMLAVDPRTEELYLATTDYATHSVLYRIDEEGRVIARYADAGGINTSRAAFRP